ncbi:MAG: hypothetical protein GAK43_02549 [Stenotrophomonas maltophilia]|nr:MAG: hypothetical protein GAK43_02549 [Stenotrophomonas maltophilia]
MRRALKPTEQRIAALSLLLLSIAAGYFLLIHGWFTAPLLDMAEEADALRDAHRHYQQLLSQREALETQLARLSDASAVAGHLLDGPDSGAAEAQLMSLLDGYTQSAAIDGATCRLSNRAPANTQTLARAGYRPVQVTVSLECGVHPLLLLLQSIEGGHPDLTVDALTVQRGAPAKSLTEVQLLSVQLTVSGYLREGAETWRQP